jgi:hypothetical protein
LEVSVKILAVVIPVKGVWSLNSPNAPAPRAWTTLSGFVSVVYGSRIIFCLRSAHGRSAKFSLCCGSLEHISMIYNGGMTKEDEEKGEKAKIL